MRFTFAVNWRSLISVPTVPLVELSESASTDSLRTSNPTSSIEAWLERITSLIEGEPVQEYLQRHYIAAYQQVAHRLRDLDCVTNGTQLPVVISAGCSTAYFAPLPPYGACLLGSINLASLVLDPFTAQTTLLVNCDVVEPSTGQLYARCPRSTASK